MYSCPKCNKTFDSSGSKTTRCPFCGNRIIYKSREPVARDVSTD